MKKELSISEQKIYEPGERDTDKVQKDIGNTEEHKLMKPEIVGSTLDVLKELSKMNSRLATSDSKMQSDAFTKILIFNTNFKLMLVMKSPACHTSREPVVGWAAEGQRRRMSAHSAVFLTLCHARLHFGAGKGG